MAENKDRQKLIDLIKGLDAINNEDKSAIIELISENTKYGLVWENKVEDIEQMLKDKLPIIVEDTKKRIINDTNNEKYPNHVIIEGDNLHALTTLCYTHEGKIDVIYIDPPYNRGEDDFVYNDKFVNIDDEYRHSKWLSFMDKRLKLAQRLLKDDGLIFVSIDNNEVFQLKILCDRYFDFVECFLWNKTSTPPALSNKSRKTHEYILCFQKILNSSEKFVGLTTSGGDAPLLNESNRISTLHFPANYVKCKLENQTLQAGRTDRVILENDIIVENGLIINDFSLTGRFRWTQEFLDSEIENNCSLIIKSKKCAIRYCREGDRTVAPPNFITERFYNTTINKTDNDVDTNETAGEELKNLLGDVPFDFPKPTSLISYLLSFKQNKSIQVLDFFAGSGTTLHACVNLNKTDLGNRKCILVQHKENENNICEEITYERNKRVIQGYTNAKGEEVEGLKQNNLRYYRTDFAPRRKTIKNQMKLMQLSIAMLQIKEDIYSEQKTFGGIKLDKNICRFFKDKEKSMLIIFDEDFIEQVVCEIKQMDIKEPIKIYIFHTHGISFEDDFSEVKEKVNLCTLPQAIYNAYRDILPKEEEEKDFSQIELTIEK